MPRRTRKPWSIPVTVRRTLASSSICWIDVHRSSQRNVAIIDSGIQKCSSCWDTTISKKPCTLQMLIHILFHNFANVHYLQIITILSPFMLPLKRTTCSPPSLLRHLPMHEQPPESASSLGPASPAIAPWLAAAQTSTLAPHFPHQCPRQSL